jgi:CheY-like chemotaxis protein
MDGDRLDPRRFRDRIGSVIERRIGGRDTVLRAYGEMVDLLAQEQNLDAAIQLENHWNDLAGRYPLSVLCGCAMARFDRDAHAAQFHELLHAHTDVVPAEGYTQAEGEDAKTREVGRLQQRARALETEVAHRRTLEQALHDALVDRERARLLKDEFLAVLSHELRTPLNAILGWSHLVRDPQTDEATLRRALEFIRRNAVLQARLIDDLLDSSRVGSGRLPSKDLEIDSTAPFEPGDVGPPSSVLERARVLVVGDGQDARGRLRDMLERAGASVETAASADEAIGRVASAPPDLMVADLEMPGQDGYALIAGIRSLPNPTARRILAIAVSAHAGHGDRAIVAGFDDWVSKPIDARRLETVAAALLIGRSDRAF